ncbi:MAG TPA: alkaline phosphatase D family protein [Allosphingosinicella sp.]|jgi:alkaline phosphatase D
MMRRFFLAPAAALLAAGCATAPAPRSAEEALRAYYATVSEPLPVAPPGAVLDRAAGVSRIAFGSCVNQDRHMNFWAPIAAKRPDLFLMIGDNVYGDTRATGAATIPTLSASYARLAARPEFGEFRARVPMLAVWDDHDYGHNDAGGSFAFREYAERTFETFWGSDPAVRARPGVHQEVVVGPDGRRVQIILLDTRFFRSDLKSIPYQEKAPPLGWYVPTDDPQATLLGEQQWRWLEQALDTPAELRVIVSSIQIVTDAHGFEKWGNFPRDRERFYRLLDAKGVDNAVVLSGDRHQGGVYRSPQRPGLYELTSSSLNFSFADPRKPWSEPDPSRLGDIYGQENFGMVEIDWASGRVDLLLYGSDGALITRQSAGAIARR